MGQTLGPAVNENKSFEGLREHPATSRHTHSPKTDLSVLLWVDTQTHIPTAVSFLFLSQTIFKCLQFIPC